MAPALETIKYSGRRNNSELSNFLFTQPLGLSSPGKKEMITPRV